MPGNLDNYNNDRMKVELDSNFAKPLLQKYLNYKKKFIQASANADDPTQSKEVVQYHRLAEQYLKQYHALQAKIQKSYTSAQQESDRYKLLSQRYQKVTVLYSLCSHCSHSTCARLSLVVRVRTLTCALLTLRVPKDSR